MRELKILFSRRDLWSFAGISTLVFFGSLLEIIGIGLVFPFVTALNDPDKIATNRFAEPVLDLFNISGADSIVIALGIGIIGVFVLKNLYLVVQWRVVHGVLTRQGVALRVRLLSRYIQAPYTFHAQRNSADLIRNVNAGVSAILGSILQPAMVIFSDGVLVLGAVTLLLIAQPLATGAALGIIGGAGTIFVLIVRRRLRRIGEAQVRTQAAIFRWLHDSLEATKEIKVLGREDYFIGGYATDAAESADASRQNTLIGIYPRLIIESLAIIAIIVAIIIMQLQTDSFEDSIPSLALFAAATIRMLPAVSRLISATNSIRFARPALQAASDQYSAADMAVSEIESFATGAPLSFERALNLKALSLTYPGASRPAIDSVTLTIKPGEYVAFAGSSGAGKTTIVNLLLGLLQPSSGVITADGVSIAENPAAWQQIVGYIPQDIHISDESIQRNVAFGIYDDDIDEGRVWSSLEAAHLAEFVRDLPDGVETKVGQRGVRISGGQRQRIGIARALYHDPSVLVLDEATSSLDYVTEQNIMSEIMALAGHKTIILVTHRIGAIQTCDTIHLLREGKVIGSGTYDDLMATMASFQAFAAAHDPSTSK